MDLDRGLVADRHDERAGLHVVGVLVSLVGLERPLAGRIALPQAQLDLDGHEP